MKIAVEARPIKWSYGTGIGNYTYCLLEKLNEIDHQNEYTFLWPDDNPSPFIPFTKKYGYYFMPKDDTREEIEIPLWLNSERADIFHLTQNGFRTPAKSPCKIIVTIHDLIPYFLPEVVRPSFLKRFIHEMPFIVNRADHIITVSESSKKDIMDIFEIDSAKISVIPSAPAVGYRILPTPETKARLKREYGLNNRYILYVGGLNPRKNVAELIYAYSKINRDLPQNQKLLIFGPDGKHLTRLQLLVESLALKEDVIFPGFVKSEDLPLFYNGADLFVYPSLYEGFGLPPIEAMACGVPVITSNVSSLPEVVGDAALKVNPYDTLQLAEEILKILTDHELRGTLIQKGLEHCKRYNWDRIARQVLALYESLVMECPVLKAAGS